MPRLDAGERLLHGPKGATNLTQSETTVLETLLNGSEPAAAAQLARALGYEDAASAATVRTHLSNLRRKARDVGLPRLIRTIRGVGYRAELEPVPDGQRAPSLLASPLVPR